MECLSKHWGAFKSFVCVSVCVEEFIIIVKVCLTLLVTTV